MKKIFGILSVFIVIGLITCVVVGFCRPVLVGVPKNFAFTYKLFTGFEFFIRYMPAMVITGFAVSCAVHFGRNPEGSADRFSKAMTDRYKVVMISALIICAVLTIFTEIFGLLIRQKKETIINQPKIINEYVQVGNNLYDNGHYERAMVYADAALELSPDYQPALRLRDKADVELTRLNNVNYRFRLYEAANETVDSVNHVDIDPDQILEVYKCYKMAKDYYNNEEWFNAHYYAQLGMGRASPKDPNLKELQQISTNSWNNLTQLHKLSKTQDQLYFEKKYEGYLALVQKDDLKAYYIYKELYETSPDLYNDPDVQFYLDIAENRVKERFFFIDETLELSSFENSNDVYFAHTYIDGSVDVFYYKGVTTVGETGNSIQYLRNFTIQTVDAHGNLYRTMTVPYAKVLPVSVKSLNSTTKMLLGIDDSVKFLPYVMLNSVARDNPGSEMHAEFVYADGQEEKNPDYMLLPIPYTDFIMLQNAGQNPDLMAIPNLLKMVKKAEMYGFSPEIYGLALLNRLMFPFTIILIFLFIASFGWNNRIEMNEYFKMVWVLVFPIIFVLAELFYRLCLFCTKLINFTLLACVNSIVAGIFAGLGIYIVLFIVLSIYFCARRTRV